MMREHFGPGGESIRLISPGTRFNTGDGIRMAIEQGADAAGEWSGMHSEPIDPRSQNSAPVVLVYPYGIVVDRNGRRFFDEGGGLVHETWETFSRRIHFETPGPRGLCHPRQPPARDRGLSARHPLGGRRPIRRTRWHGLAGLIGVDPRQSRRDRRGLQCGGDRRPGNVRRHALRRACGVARPATAEVQLGACHRSRRRSSPIR